MSKGRITTAPQAGLTRIKDCRSPPLRGMARIATSPRLSALRRRESEMIGIVCGSDLFTQMGKTDATTTDDIVGPAIDAEGGSASCRFLPPPR
jgi:hypothetical protein